MPPNSRIISIDSGKILVKDAVANLKKMYTFIKALDVKPTPELRRKWAESAKRYEAAAKAREQAAKEKADSVHKAQ